MKKAITFHAFLLFTLNAVLANNEVKSMAPPMEKECRCPQIGIRFRLVEIAGKIKTPFKRLMRRSVYR